VTDSNGLPFPDPGVLFGGTAQISSIWVAKFVGLMDACLVVSDQPLCMRTDDSQATIARLSALTPAEQAVLDQALTGVPARQIAEHLSLSEATVRSHLSSIYVKLGVSGRVALLAHFRGGESVVPGVEAPPAPRPISASVAGWSWAAVALLEGAYAVYLGSAALANGGTQTIWLLTIGFGLLAAFCTRLARAILDRPSRRTLFVSLAVAGGHLLFAIRGIFLGVPQPPFMVVGAIAIAIGWISFWAMGAYPAATRPGGGSP
jgi:DNA-binding CsgD family transcriptional regulator